MWVRRPVVTQPGNAQPCASLLESCCCSGLAGDRDREPSGFRSCARARVTASQSATEAGSKGQGGAPDSIRGDGASLGPLPRHATPQPSRLLDVRLSPPLSGRIWCSRPPASDLPG